jgi:hypothetical protein
MPASVPQRERSSSHVHAPARELLACALREQLTRDGALDMEAVGSSMEPTVPGGSVLSIEPLHGAPAIDDLIVFVPEHGELLCCHRVIAQDERGHILTQGDRHKTPDGFARPDQIIGVVRSFELGGRNYRLGPELPRPRPTAYRMQRQRLVRLLRRMRVAL